MANALQTTYQSLEASLEALAYSNHCLSENVSAIHQAIRENHLVYLPKVKESELSQLFEIETQIENNLFLVHYSAEKYGSEYDIKILQVSRCHIEELEYKVLNKIEKTIHDKLLNECDMHYYKKHYEWADYDTAFNDAKNGNY